MVSNDKFGTLLAWIKFVSRANVMHWSILTMRSPVAKQSCNPGLWKP